MNQAWWRVNVVIPFLFVLDFRTSDKDGKGVVEKRFALSGASSVSDKNLRLIKPLRGRNISPPLLSRLCLMFWNKFFPLLKAWFHRRCFLDSIAMIRSGSKLLKGILEYSLVILVRRIHDTTNTCISSFLTSSSFCVLQQLTRTLNNLVVGDFRCLSENPWRCDSSLCSQRPKFRQVLLCDDLNRGSACQTPSHLAGKALYNNPAIWSIICGKIPMFCARLSGRTVELMHNSWHKLNSRRKRLQKPCETKNISFPLNPTSKQTNLCRIYRWGRR